MEKIIISRNLLHSKNLEYKRKLEFIKKSREFSEYLTEISKLSIKIAKMKLNHISFQCDNLIERINFLINKSSIYEKFYAVNYKCKICRDSGYVDGKICKCLKNIEKIGKLELLNKYLPIKNFRFENFKIDFYPNEIMPNSKFTLREVMRQTFNYCLSYANNFSINSPNLFITGKTGLGKTHISASIANILAENNFSVLYFSLPNLIQFMEEEKFFNKSEFSPLRNEIMVCDCLILDDLGTEFVSSFSISMVYNILNTRMMKKMPTILNTNLKLNELEEKYDSRIVSRIIGNFIPIRFFGDDIRQKKMIYRKGDKNVSV